AARPRGARKASPLPRAGGSRRFPWHGWRSFQFLPRQSQVVLQSLHGCRGALRKAPAWRLSKSPVVVARDSCPHPVTKTAAVRALSHYACRLSGNAWKGACMAGWIELANIFGMAAAAGLAFSALANVALRVAAWRPGKTAFEKELGTPPGVREQRARRALGR